MRMHLQKICWMAFAVIILSSCAGYRAGNIQGAEMRNVKTIYVPTVKNHSYEPGLATLTTNAILRQMDNDGTFTSARKKEADAVLEVTLKELRRKPLRRTRTDVQVTEQYEVLLEGQATLTNLRTGDRVFTNRRVVGKARYFVQGNLQEGERQVMPIAADNFAYNLVKLFTDGW